MVVSFIADAFAEIERMELRVDELIISENVYMDLLKVSDGIFGKDWDKENLWGAKVTVDSNAQDIIIVKNLDNDMVITKNRHQM